MLASVVETGGIVTVIGTAQDDSIVITTTSNPGFTDISVNHGQPGATYGSFTTSSIQNVLVYAGAGDDAVYSSATVPTEVNGQSGDDILTGGSADDIIRGGIGEDRIYGRLGDDVLVGGDDRDRMFGAAGADRIFSQGGNDLIYGHAGNDFINAGIDDDVVIAGDGNDTVFGGAGEDNISGNAGEDTLYGNGGNDRIVGGTGNDTLAGREGNDSLFGQEGNDFIVGLTGDDLLVGGNGNDFLDGMEGMDSLFGGGGEDYLEGGLDTVADQLNGGAGSDTFVNRDNDFLEDVTPTFDNVIVVSGSDDDDDGGPVAVLPSTCSSVVHDILPPNVPGVPSALASESVEAFSEVVDDIIVNDFVVILAAYGDYPGNTTGRLNNSIPVTDAIAEVLHRNEIDFRQGVFEVNWRNNFRNINDTIKIVKGQFPGRPIMFLGIGQGLNAYTLETRGANLRGMVQPDGTRRDPTADIVRFAPNPNIPDQAVNMVNGPAFTLGQYSAENIVNEIRSFSPGLPVGGSINAGGYVCDAATYTLNGFDQLGTIELGAFFHVPQVSAPAQNQAFAEGLVNSLLGTNADPDGDGRINAEDSFPFNDQLN